MNPEEISIIFKLLVAFQFKHWLCDYPMQTPYMLRKSSANGFEWVRPLVAHAGVHAVFTYMVLCIFLWDLPVTLMFSLAILDFIVHFSVDRIKASPRLLGRFNPSQPYFWWALGWDQAMHHLTNYLIIWICIGSLLPSVTR